MTQVRALRFLLIHLLTVSNSPYQCDLSTTCCRWISTMIPLPPANRYSGDRAPHRFKSPGVAHFCDALARPPPPFRGPSEYAEPTPNPYNHIVLTFLATILRRCTQSPGKISRCSSPTYPIEAPSTCTRRSRPSAFCSSQTACKPFPGDGYIRSMGRGGSNADSGTRTPTLPTII